jgi:hypothetical protein
VTEYYFLYTKHFWQNGENSPRKKLVAKIKSYFVIMGHEWFADESRRRL